MIGEQRRRAYLDAMQVDSWLPVHVLPFAAASRAAVLQRSAQPQGAAAQAETVPIAPPPSSVVPVSAIKQARAVLETFSQPAAVALPESPDVKTESVLESSNAAVATVPRFSLQLFRAGACLLLVELPTGEAFQSRDPAYLLLKDLLRAAGLPDSPQLLGEPVRWPLLASGNLDQGPQASRDFLHGFLATQMEGGQGCACLWLVGLPALRHVCEVEADMYNRELQIEGLGPAWAVPGLELLMDEPQRKASLWQAMRRLMSRWKPADV